MCQNSFELFDRTVYQVCDSETMWDNDPDQCSVVGVELTLSIPSSASLIIMAWVKILFGPLIWVHTFDQSQETLGQWLTVSGSGERHLKMSDFVKLCLEIICHRLIVIMYDITDHTDSSWASLSWQYWVSWQDTNIVDTSGDSGDHWPRCAQCWPRSVSSVNSHHHLIQSCQNL